MISALSLNQPPLVFDLYAKYPLAKMFTSRMMISFVFRRGYP
jgi:hypothetical protein